MSCVRPQSRTAPRGFTIIEILVTIGILVLVSLGVSAIFNSIATTVNKGKRVAELNRFSAQLERVMRRDFENITRDGYLVIVHQYAPGDEPDNAPDDRDVRLSPADISDEDDNGDRGRPRRIDEIMFFTRGQYETARRAITPSMIARSSEAAIYYGHGQRRRVDFDNGFDNPTNDINLFFNPSTRDTNIRYNISGGQNQAALGFRSTDGGLNPNEYASDWTLLRHVTLLAKPLSSGQDLPNELFGISRIGDERQWLEDSDRQIALQPAGRSIFNSLSQSGFNNLPDPTGAFTLPKWFGERIINTGGPVPFGYTDPILRASGLVDIVTDDLDSIRTILTGVSGTTDTNFDEPSDYWSRNNLNRIATPMDLSYDELASLWEDDAMPPSPSDALGLDLTDIAGPGAGSHDHHRNIRLWMIDSLPSLWDLSELDNPTPLSRVRYEAIPTQMLFEQDAFGNPDDDNSNRLRTYAEANQEMLGSSIFIPRCTEFIVEWSFGHIDMTITDPTHPRYKQMLWYGMERWVDANNDGIIDDSGNGFTPGEDQLVAQYYRRRADPGITNFDRGPFPELVVGHPAIFGGFGSPPDHEIATFGYPDARGNQWPWPKFIRVTISVADPSDLTLERTFQMVFEIPDASRN